MPEAVVGEDKEDCVVLPVPGKGDGVLYLRGWILMGYGVLQQWLQDEFRHQAGQDGGIDFRRKINRCSCPVIHDAQVVFQIVQFIAEGPGGLGVSEQRLQQIAQSGHTVSHICGLADDSHPFDRVQGIVEKMRAELVLQVLYCQFVAFLLYDLISLSDAGCSGNIC